MVRRWVAVVAVVMAAVVVAGCSSDGGSSAGTPLPKLTRKDWTAAGLATAKATTDAIAAALPGQCADAAVSAFSTLAENMQAVDSKVEPTAQMTCNVNEEVVEISAFATGRERDRFVDDRSTGLCRLSAAEDKKHKSRSTFPGLRWAVGAGNLTVQPDTETLARRLALITKGTYEPRACDNGVHSDWNPKAINALDALGAKVAASGHGCTYVPLVGRETFPRTQSFTDAQFPIAVGNCAFDGQTLGIVTYLRSTPKVKEFIGQEVTAGCTGDPALGRIDGDGFTVLAPGTIAEQVQAVTGGTLAPTACA